MGKDPREVIGHDDRAIYPPAGAGMLMASDRKVMEQGEVQTLEETLPTPLGVLTFLTTKGPIYDQNGDLMGLFGIARDISERKESEAKYSRIVNTAAEGIWAVGADGKTTFVNAKMVEMLGCLSEDVIGQPLSRFMFEDEHPEAARRLERRRKGIAENYECRLRRKNGETVWVSASATPILNGELDFQGSFAMLTDITERKRAEQELRESEAKIRCLINSSIIGIFTFELPREGEEATNPYYGYVNDAFLRMLGYGREEFTSRPVRRADLSPPEWWERDMESLAELRATGAVKPFEKEYFRKDGSRLPVWAGVAAYDEARTQGVAFVLDISERKRDEERLRTLAEQRAILESALNRSHEGAYIMDAEGHFRYVNDEACRALGYRREELLSMSVLETSIPIFPANGLLRFIGA